MLRLSILETIDKKDFWAKAKKWVKVTITHLRSTKLTEMRYTLHGKRLDCVSLFVTFYPNATLEDWLHEFNPEDESEVGKKQCDITL